MLNFLFQISSVKFWEKFKNLAKKFEKNVKNFFEFLKNFLPFNKFWVMQFDTTIFAGSADEYWGKSRFLSIWTKLTEKLGVIFSRLRNYIIATGETKIKFTHTTLFLLFFIFFAFKCWVWDLGICILMKKYFSPASLLTSPTNSRTKNPLCKACYSIQIRYFQLSNIHTNKIYG